MAAAQTRRARRIDRLALLALAALVVGYSALSGDEFSASAGPAWIGVGAIALSANLARLRLGINPSSAGLAVGVAALLLGLLRTIGVVAEVTLPIAIATVALPALVARLLDR